MGIPIPLIPAGARVRVRRANWPLDARVIGRSGVVVVAGDYHPERYGVMLEGEREMRYFRPEELEVTAEPPLLPPEREAAKRRRALP